MNFNDYHTILKHWKGCDSAKLLMRPAACWHQNQTQHTQAQTTQTTDILDESRCKNSQKKKKSANQSQHYIKKITYHDQVGIYLRGAKVAQHSKISKCQKSCQQNEEQKPYDPFNRCREGILYFKTKTLNKLWYRRKIPQSDKGHIWLNNSHIVVKRKSWKNFSSYLEQDNDVQFYCSYSLYRCHLGQLVQGLKLESHTTPT